MVTLLFHFLSGDDSSQMTLLLGFSFVVDGIRGSICFVIQDRVMHRLRYHLSKKEFVIQNFYGEMNEINFHPTPSPFTDLLNYASSS
jgi:hypothetical protein